jgi:hypothetical protein
LKEFDDFLNSIVKDGYQPIFFREERRWDNRFGISIAVAVTAWKAEEIAPAEEPNRKHFGR